MWIIIKTTAPKNILKLNNPEYLSERCCSLTFTSPKFPVSIDMRSVVNSKEVLLQWDSIAEAVFYAIFVSDACCTDLGGQSTWQR